MRKVARHFLKWGWIWAVAALLLLISQVVWLWETWPVRQLLEREQALHGEMR